MFCGYFLIARNKKKKKRKKGENIGSSRSAQIDRFSFPISLYISDEEEEESNHSICLSNRHWSIRVGRTSIYIYIYMYTNTEWSDSFMKSCNTLSELHARLHKGFFKFVAVLVTGTQVGHHFPSSCLLEYIYTTL